MNTNRILTFILVILLLALLSIYYPQLTGDATTTPDYYPKENAVLTRVVDGDTIHALVNGEDQTIRMLGINSPEKKMPFSNESANFLRQFENKTIQLLRDWEDTDKYHRKLRYVFVGSRFLNLEIIQQGMANSYYYAGLRYEEEILKAEKSARLNALGIWEKSQENCAVENCIILEKLDSTKEFFTISNTCDFTCSLDGWFIKDSGRNTFYLSSLSAGEEKAYYSEKLGKEVWNNEGDRFFMFDKSGKLVLFYEY